MNAKYYPQLRQTALLTQSLINSNPSLVALNKQAKKPTDLLTPIHHAITDTLGNTSKDTALEVCKMLFYGTYLEVNAHYL